MAKTILDGIVQSFPVLKLSIKRLVLSNQNDTFGFINCDEIFQSFDLLLCFVELGFDMTGRTVAGFKFVDDSITLFEQICFNFIILIE